MTRRSRRRKKPVKVPDSLHSALRDMQREFKKKRGVEPSLGDLIEKAFEEDPVLDEVLSAEKSSKDESVWNEDFMKL